MLECWNDAPLSRPQSTSYVCIKRGIGAFDQGFAGSATLDALRTLSGSSIIAALLVHDGFICGHGWTPDLPGILCNAFPLRTGTTSIFSIFQFLVSPALAKNWFLEPTWPTPGRNACKGSLRFAGLGLPGS